MTSAQELHHLAALAAGHELRWSHEWPGDGCFMRRVVPEPEHPGSKWAPWRPLNDDHDALLFEAEELVTLQAWQFDVTMRLLEYFPVLSQFSASRGSVKVLTEHNPDNRGS